MSSKPQFRMGYLECIISLLSGYLSTIKEAYILLSKLCPPRLKSSPMNSVTWLPKPEILTISFNEFREWTWGYLVSSVALGATGICAMVMRASTTSFRDGLGALAERILVMAAGMPADRRVVDSWCMMHSMMALNY